MYAQKLQICDRPQKVFRHSGNSVFLPICKSDGLFPDPQDIVVGSWMPIVAIPFLKHKSTDTCRRYQKKMRDPDFGSSRVNTTRNSTMKTKIYPTANNLETNL